MSEELSHIQPQQPVYIEGVGWRNPVEHCMTRWPYWKDARKPGTYMVTLNVNGGKRLLGTLAGSTYAVYEWMKTHPEAVDAASADALYYRHALLGTRAMPFVQGPPAVETAAHKDAPQPSPSCAPPSFGPSSPSSFGASSCAGVSTPGAVAAPPSPSFGPSSCAGVSTPGAVSAVGAAASPSPSCGPSSCAGVSTPGAVGAVGAAAPSSRPRTHFPLEALRQADAPHIVLSPLGEKVKACWERMPQVEPGIELVCLAIMPNHLHAIIAVRRELPRPIGSVLRSFMGVTSHTLHQMIAAGSVCWQSSEAKPSLWSKGYCVGVCQTEQKLHTRIGYVLENPFFGILEGERHNFMERVMWLTIAGRPYSCYGNMLLLKEPDRLQVFCHRRHPATREPYHLTQDFREERAAVLRAAADGAVIVTPGISPGEAEIMWAVLRGGGAVINLQKDEIPLSDKWHPSNERRLYCSLGRLLVLSVRDLPRHTFRDCHGDIIPAGSTYARFHLLNLVAEELCSEGIEHQCVVVTH